MTISLPGNFTPEIFFTKLLHMLDKFKERLKAKAKALGANLSQARIDAIADRLHKKNPDITEEADHDARIDDFNDLQPLSDIAKEEDRIRTLEAKAKGQPPKNEPPAPKEEEAKPSADDLPAWAKVFVDELKQLKAKETTQTLNARLREKLKDKKIPEALLSKYSVEKEEDLDSVATKIEEDFTALRQDLVNQGLMSNTPPVNAEGGKVAVKAFEANVDSWLEGKVEKKETK